MLNPNCAVRLIPHAIEELRNDTDRTRERLVPLRGVITDIEIEDVLEALYTVDWSDGCEGIVVERWLEEDHAQR